MFLQLQGKTAAMTATLESLAVTMLRKPSQDSMREDVQEWLKKVDFEDPLFEGYVFKQKSNSSNVMNSLSCFNRRYFVLLPGIVLYYEHKRDYREDVKYGMRRYKVLKLDGLYLTHVKQLPANSRFCINLHLPNPFNKRDEMLLAFHTRKQKREWMLYLQSQNPKLVRNRKH